MRQMSLIRKQRSFFHNNFMLAEMAKLIHEARCLVGGLVVNFPIHAYFELVSGVFGGFRG